MDQTELLRYALGVLDRLSIPHMIVGSFASAVYGEPRFTHDIDIVVDLSDRVVSDVVQAFPAPSFYVSESATREAIRTNTQFNVLHPESGNKIDFMLPRSDEWGRTQLERRRHLLLLPDQMGFVASPEDVILGKLWYFAESGSEKHLRDILSMLYIQSEGIDRSFLESWVRKLGYDEIWRAILSRESRK